jgi:hypothetical protein
MLNVASRSLVVCSDGVTTLSCVGRRCRSSFKTTELVSSGARYICRHHSPVHRHVKYWDS